MQQWVASQRLLLEEIQYSSANIIYVFNILTPVGYVCENVHAMTKKYKNQAGMNVTPTPPVR